MNQPYHAKHEYKLLTLCLTVIMACSIMWADIQGQFSHKIKQSVTQLFSPLYTLVDVPIQFGHEVMSLWDSHQNLQQENQALKVQLFKLRAQMLQARTLKVENKQLYNLLGSQKTFNQDVVLGRLISFKTNPFTHTAIINRGSKHGIQKGQPIIDDYGIIGMVQQTSLSYAKMLLLTDPKMAIPVISARSNERAIAYGTGREERLVLKHVPITADFNMGDTLVTSGLDGQFLPGYPVGMVTRVNVDRAQQFKTIWVEPFAKVDESRYVLFVAPQKQQVSLEESNHG